MMKSNILYMKGMNNTESEPDEEEQDIWDDRKLNDAYDKAVKIANIEVARRLAMSTNTGHDNGDQAKNKRDKHEDKAASQHKKKDATKWKAGMPCRAVYEEDGLEYEALLQRVINDKECVVKFIGYDNTEIVPLSSLKPSRGKKHWAQQIEDAFNDKTDDGFASQSPNDDPMMCDSDRIPSPGSTVVSSQLNKKSQKKRKNNKNMNVFNLAEMPMPNLDMLRNVGNMEMPIPPPMPFPMSSSMETEDQALSSMLLSWYMSGYYTGLYHGMRKGSNPRRNI